MCPPTDRVTEVQNLIRQIDEAFGSLPYPGDERIVRDSSGTHLEAQQVKRALAGRHWRDVSFDTLDELGSALFFLTPQGYRFYLPAFLVYVLTDFERADVVPDEIIQTLTAPDPVDVDRIEALARRHPELQPFDSEVWKKILSTVSESYQSGSAEREFLERVYAFDNRQGKAIRRFLEYMQNVFGDEFAAHEPRVAIERYWHRF